MPDVLVHFAACDSTTVLDGFTVRQFDGLLLIEGGNPVIRNSVLHGALRFSAAFLRDGARPSFQNVQFLNNRGELFLDPDNLVIGGAVWDETGDCHPRFQNVLFEGNGSFGHGGAVSGRGTFIDVEFRGNATRYGGGAVWGGGSFERCTFIGNAVVSRPSVQDDRGGAVAGDGTFLDVQFINNTAQSLGGAVYADGPVSFTNAVFRANRAAYGAAIYSDYGGVEMANGLIADGSATYQAGGVMIATRTYDDPPPSRFVNVTFALNRVVQVSVEARPCADVYSQAGTLEIVNSICWIPAAYDYDDVYPVYSVDSRGIARNSIIRLSSVGTWFRQSFTDGGGVLDVDPLFADEIGKDYRLAGGSPAIDAGDTFALPESIRFDLAGDPRYMRGAIDIGGYEAIGPISVGDQPPSVPVPGHYVRASPNPFNPITTVYFGLRDAGPVRVTIHDLAGRRVRSLFTGSLGAGDHQQQWNGADDAGRIVASGTYICRIRSGQRVQVARLVLLK